MVKIEANKKLIRNYLKTGQINEAQDDEEFNMWNYKATEVMRALQGLKALK